MKKYNNKSASVRDWTTPRLESELLQMRNYIDDGCFGVNDLRFECAIASELDRRSMLRSATKKERLAMEHRQIAEVKR